MSTASTTFVRRAAGNAQGFTLVELMVAITVAIFLINGLVMVMQNMRIAYNNQQAIAQLQDEQRFATTVITDIVQSGGYYPQANHYDSNAFTVQAPYNTLGQAFYGTHIAGQQDTLGVRYMTAVNDGVILCNGSSNTTVSPVGLYTNTFTVVAPTATMPGQLMCQISVGIAAPGNAVAIANGVVGLTVWYGVKRNFSYIDYNVDTYLTADQMLAADWINISSVRVIITFTNPMATQAGQTLQPTISFERVIQVMGRAGDHT